ncbi:hypothetical protein JVT61DRAFT_12761 [Boletus reticuloceps]|uniref:Mediator of RNA polymerase II transcription subunit 18 n=1 Tax=Boletus reticuloceps TaxID=495285 RepID=A0A8I3ADI8_9AGAM|nr:hypothetical protein JVT61DRAFT_12761 [Boletus reticuloceps]
MSSVTPSAAHAYYEVALFGEFFARDLKPILNRLTLHTESATPMHTREIVFEHIGAQGLVQSGSQDDEPVLLRARKELGDGKESGCQSLYAYIQRQPFVRGRSARSSGMLLVLQALSDTYIQTRICFPTWIPHHSDVSARTGTESLTESLSISSLSTSIEVDPKTSLSTPAHADTLWEVEVKTATQVNTAAPVAGQVQTNTVRSAIEAVLEVQFIMKGLLDLRRRDI